MIDNGYTDTSLHKVDYVLLIMNFIDGNIQFKYEIENNDALPSLDIVSRTDEGFSKNYHTFDSAKLIRRPNCIIDLDFF